MASLYSDKCCSVINELKIHWFPAQAKKETWRMQKWGVFPLISKHLSNIFLYNLWIVNAFENGIPDLFPVPTHKNLRWLELQGMLIILLWPAALHATCSHKICPRRSCVITIQFRCTFCCKLLVKSIKTKNKSLVNNYHVPYCFYWMFLSLTARARLSWH